MTTATNPYLAAFPANMVPRPEQAAFLDRMPQYRDRDLLAGLPTGVGKSGIGTAVTAAEGSGYLVSPLTQHVDQFCAAFPFLRPGQASSSHLCLAGEARDTCRDYRDATDEYCEECPYVRQRDRWLAGPVSISTTEYLYQRASHPDVTKRPERRSRIVVDEAHALERSLVNHEGYTCSVAAANALRIALPIHPASEAPETRHPALLHWIASALIPAQATRLAALEVEIAIAKQRFVRAKKHQRQEAVDQLRKLRRERQALVLDHDKCETLSHRQPGTFVAWTTCDPGTKRASGVAIKPLEVRSAYRRLIQPFGDHVLLMSATIYPDFLCRTLGIAPPAEGCSLAGASGTGYITCASPFPPANHRILFRSCGSMGFRERAETMPALLHLIEMILDKRINEKGIIHGQTHATCQAIQQHFAGTKHGARLLVIDRDGVLDTAGKLVRHHIAARHATVLLSPSMQEGVDLPGDASTFQVICQLPYPDLSDPWIKQRRLGPDGEAWYAVQTAQVMVQALGRSLRTVDDHCTSYILDDRFRRFYADWRQFFPIHIQKSLEGSGI